MPSMSSSSAPGIAAAVARPPETCTIWSARPWIDQGRHPQRAQPRAAVGLGEDRQHLAHHAVGAEPAVPGLLGAGAAPPRGPRGRPGSRSSATAAPRSRRTPSRPGPRGAISIGSSLGCCQPTVRLPIVDMMLVSERTRAGCSIAIVCTIIPPIDTPTTCADVEPEVVEQAERVVGHVGQGVRRPARAAGEGPHQRRAADPAADLASSGRCRGCRSGSRRSRARRAACRAPGPTRSSGRRGPSPAAAARRRGRRRSGSTARRRGRPGRRAPRRRDGGSVSVACAMGPVNSGDGTGSTPGVPICPAIRRAGRRTVVRS